MQLFDMAWLFTACWDSCQLAIVHNAEINKFSSMTRETAHSFVASALLIVAFYSCLKLVIQHFSTWFVLICVFSLVAHGVGCCYLDCRLRMSMGQKRKSLGLLASHTVTGRQRWPWDWTPVCRGWCASRKTHQIQWYVNLVPCRIKRIMAQM